MKRSAGKRGPVTGAGDGDDLAGSRSATCGSLSAPRGHVHLIGAARQRDARGTPASIALQPASRIGRAARRGKGRRDGVTDAVGWGRGGWRSLKGASVQAFSPLIQRGAQLRKGSPDSAREKMAPARERTGRRSPSTLSRAPLAGMMACAKRADNASRKRRPVASL